jgi:Cu+-exporting ATPase
MRNMPAKETPMADMSIRTAGPNPVPQGQRAAGPEEIVLRIRGMDCPHCPPNVERALRKLQGVGTAHVSLGDGTAHIGYDPAQVKVVDLVQAIRSTGYSAGTATMRVLIRNMHCSSCVIRIEQALHSTPGVVAARVNAFANSADIEYLPERTSLTDIEASIESIGYRLRLFSGPPAAAASGRCAAVGDQHRAVLAEEAATACLRTSKRDDSTLGARHDRKRFHCERPDQDLHLG